MPQQSLQSPLGNITITSNGQAITSIRFGRMQGSEEPDDCTARCAWELRAYFAGMLRNFSVPVAMDGTDFEQRVWNAMLTVPFGQTITYGMLATAIGKANAARAVGTACGKNPLIVVVPCHRIIGASDIGGYAAGIRRKKWILQHEQRG